MKKRIVWLACISLAVLSVMTASCGNTPTASAPTVPKSTAPIPATAVPTAMTSTAPDATVPKYGGTLTVYLNDPAGGFDEAFNLGHVGGMVTTPYLTNEQLLEGDWKKGPAGSHDQDWAMGFIGRSELLTGCLAESWEFPDETTIVFHIRKGVHWQNIAPVSGRELTADDIVFNINRAFTSSGSYLL